MDNRADLLMLTGLVRMCPDCDGERVFVAIDEGNTGGSDFACTTCGAALLIDPAFDYSVVRADRVA